MGHGNPNQQHLRIQVRQSFSVLGFNMVDGTLWKFEARDGKKTYAATGPLRDTFYVGHAPPEDSYADLSALFEMLKH